MILGYFVESHLKRAGTPIVERVVVEDEVWSVWRRDGVEMEEISERRKVGNGRVEKRK